jgi:hypothetical protein
MVAQTISENHFVKENLMEKKLELSALAEGLSLQFANLSNNLNIEIIYE